MADEAVTAQQAPGSPESTDAPGAPTSEVSPEPKESSKLSNIMNRALRGFMGGRGLEETSEARSEPADRAASPSEDAGPDAQTDEPAQTDAEERFQLSRSELDRFVAAERAKLQQEQEREVQSRSDRFVRKKLAEHSEQADRDRLRRTREDDPIGYVEEEKRREADMAAQQQTAAQIGNLLHNAQNTLDAAVVEPLLKLAGDEYPRLRQMIAEAAPRGQALDARKEATMAAVEAIRKAARAEGAKAAEQKLRNDRSFIKQVYQEMAEIGEEPDVAPAAGPTRRRASPSDAMNDDIRRVGRTLLGAR